METTIAAISTAMSASGIGIVRISGEDAMNVIARIYRSKNGRKNIKEVKTHTIHYGYIYDGDETVDEVLVMVMRGPKTYTGEDTVEIDLSLIHIYTKFHIICSKFDLICRRIDQNTFQNWHSCFRRNSFQRNIYAF